VDRAIEKEGENIAIYARNVADLETRVRTESKFNHPKITKHADRDWLGVADFGNKLRFIFLKRQQPLISLYPHFHADAFLEMAFIDRTDFNRRNYDFSFGSRVCFEDACVYIFDFTPAANSHGQRFLGRIWIEDRNFNIIRFSGIFVPERHFSGRKVENVRNLPFDSRRTQLSSGLWVPDRVLCQGHYSPSENEVLSYDIITIFTGHRLKDQTPHLPPPRSGKVSAMIPTILHE
jgi:hypothetical protein